MRIVLRFGVAGLKVVTNGKTLLDIVAELPSGAPLASWEIKGNP